MTLKDLLSYNVDCFLNELENIELDKITVKKNDDQEFKVISLVDLSDIDLSDTHKKILKAFLEDYLDED